MDVEIESRVERLNRMMDEGRIIRNDWTGIDEQGRETACLLAALAPEVAEAETASACPASLMPAWLAYLTPWMDDNCSDTEWSQMIRRYAACAARWSVLDDAAWRRVEIVARRVAVVEAMRHTSDEQVLPACREVLTWLDADMPESSHAAVKVAAAAVAAAGAAAGVAAEAAAKATKAAWGAWGAAKAAEAAEAAATEAWGAWAAATEVVVAAAVWSVSVGAWAATEAAAAASAAASASASESEAWSAAVSTADRIVDTVLSALEQECALAVR